jgi:hypothetical protein
MPMPYGCVDSQNLSQASRLSLEKALDWWQKSMQTSKHKTFFVLAGYDEDSGLELNLRREALSQALQDPEFLANIVEITGKNEEALAQRITHIRDLLPIETITIFAESRHAVSVKAIFRRKFGKTLEMKKFKADFEFDHRWISTSSSFAWISRNLLLRIWFESKKRMGRNLRKKLRFLFRS